MNIDILDYKKYEYQNDDRERKLIANYENDIADFSIGSIINIVEDSYEIYMYVIDNKKDTIISRLLLINEENLEKAKEIHEKNCELIRKNDINLILQSLIK